MDFNITLDEGSLVEGYVIPDGFSSEANIFVYDGTRAIGHFSCDIYIESVVTHGRHSSGIVGFRIDENIVPGLSHMSGLMIIDVETNITIYKRFDAEKHIQRKVFRVETQLLPHTSIDNSLKPHFQFFSSQMEKYGHATAVQMFLLLNQPSVYLSGRILVQTLKQYFGDDFVTVVSITDPFYELAIRLLTVSQPQENTQRWLSNRDNIIFQPAFNFFAEMNIFDETEVKQKLKSAPKDVLNLFRSPFIHQFVAKSPTDQIGRDGIVTALNLLSEFNLFHAGEATTELANDFADLLNLPRESINMTTKIPKVLAFSELLSSISWLEQLLEDDLIMYHFVQQAALKSKNIS